MSIATSLLELAITCARQQNCDTLLRVRVEYGLLAGIMPDALELCFAALVAGTPHEKAKLELVCLPLRLRCPLCCAIFEGSDQDALWLPCPQCGESLGHIVEQGRELVLAQLEAVKSHD